MTSAKIATELLLSTTPVTIRRRAKWGECDPAGIVYMVNYAEYVVSAYELLMTVLLDEGLQKGKARHAIALPAKAFAIEFYAPLHPDEEFLMTVEVTDVRTKTFDMTVRGYSVERGDVFLAKLTPIAVDPKDRVAFPLPEAIILKLRNYRQSCASKNLPAASD